MASTLKELGAEGERLVGRYLESRGFTIHTYNYTQRCGEIDIIASNKDLLAFIEVKLRQKHYFNLSEVVNPTKQYKIIKAARYYVATHKLHNTVQRFDIALLEPNGNTYRITYIPNAFAPPDTL
jgi:putative endonuclease